MSSHTLPGTGSPRRRPATAVVLFALLALAFNMRPAAIAVGPVLGVLQRDVGMSDTTAGVLTAAPSMCFAIFGALAPVVGRRYGHTRTVFVATVLIVFGQVGRVFVHSAGPFLAFSALALAGMATANVLIPSLVKSNFPDRIGYLTALYSTSLSIGVTVASLATVPMANALGGWRGAFTIFAALAAVAVIPWAIMATLTPPRASHAHAHIPMSAIARTKLGWIMVGFFAIQSAMAYSIFGWLATIYAAAGYSQLSAGLMLAIATGVGIPFAFVWPASMTRNPRPVGILSFVMISGAIGTLGLLIAPKPVFLGVLWAVLLAIGTSSFPMILALLGMRARTSAGTTALSGFTQSVGYLLAALGPFGMGLLHELTHDWRLPLIVLTGSFIPMAWVGYHAITAGHIEDELPAA